MNMTNLRAQLTSHNETPDCNMDSNLIDHIPSKNTLSSNSL